MADFIDNLPIPAGDKVKLRQLGTDSPFGLLALIEAEPRVFEAFLGPTAAGIRESLLELVPNAESMLGAAKKNFPLGSKLNAAPVIKPLPYDERLRDELFAEWQDLQRDPVTRGSKRTQELQAELSALMER